MIDTEKRPVLTGLLALVAVALVVGVVGGVGVMLGLKSAGVGGGGDGGTTPGTARETLYLPEPTATATDEPDEPDEEEPDESIEEPEAPDEGITLTASQTTVSPMQQIDLTGSYPSGEGAILQVQRLEDGNWNDFPVTMSVSSQKFSTYVMTSRSGENKFRVIDTDTEQTSNEITVTVG